MALAGNRYYQYASEQATLKTLFSTLPNAQIHIWYQSQKGGDGGYSPIPTMPESGVLKWILGDPYAFERVTKIAISGTPSDTMFGGGRPVVLFDPSKSNRDHVELPSLRRLKHLEEIDIACFRLESLEGLSELKSLRKIAIYGCSAIKNVDELAGLTKLSHLEIDSCHSIENLDGISRLKQFINVEVTRCRLLNKSKEQNKVVAQASKQE